MDQITPFEYFMQDGIEQHAAGDHEAALASRLEAFASDTLNPEDRGRAARDVAASFDKLRNTALDDSSYSNPVSNEVMADAYAEYAYREHKALINTGSENGSREFTVSAMYAAIIAARQRRETDALKYIDEAWKVSNTLYINSGIVHQYDINLVGRAAGIKGAFETKPSEDTHHIGWLSIGLAKMSETPEIAGSNGYKSPQEIKKAQRNAQIRSAAARTIIGLQSLPTRNLTKPVSILILNKAVLG